MCEKIEYHRMNYLLLHKVRHEHGNFIQSYILFFPGPLAFCKKAVERVNSDKNILNSLVECSGVVFFQKKSYVCTSLDLPQ